jgi:hypothetical protein
MTLRRLLVPVLLAVAGIAAVLVAGRAGTGTAATPAPETVLASIEGVLRRDGLGAALDSLARLAEGDAAFQREGHQMAHRLGRQAVAGRAGDAGVIAECRPVFASGCYHGVVEAALHEAGRIDVPALERLCAAVEAGSIGPGGTFECIHGLGHGILGALKHDLPAALRACDGLSTLRRAVSCHAGAFMEGINTAVQPGTVHQAHDHGAPPTPAGTGRLVVDPADPYSPCRAWGDPYAASCWLFQGFVILRANGFDAARALRVCDGAPDGRAPRCYEAVGHQLTGLFQKDDEWILDQCARGQAALAARCAAGATLALDAMDWSGSRAARLCAAAPRAWKDLCYGTAASALVDLATPAERARLCDTVEAEWIAGCRQAGELPAS